MFCKGLKVTCSAAGILDFVTGEILSRENAFASIKELRGLK